MGGASGMGGNRCVPASSIRMATLLVKWVLGGGHHAALPEGASRGQARGLRGVTGGFAGSSPVSGLWWALRLLSCGYGKTLADRISRRDLPRDVSGQWETGLDPGKPDGPAKPVRGRRPVYLKPETGLDPASLQ